MVLFDEDPVTLISQTTSNFHTSSDLSSLTRISESLTTLRNARSLRLSESQRTLSTLSRRLHHLAQSHRDEVSHHDAADHEQQMRGLDNAKFNVAKAASSLEIEGERMEAELRLLKTRLDALELEGVEGSRLPSDAEDDTLLKLHFYRSLGVDVEQDATTGDFNRAVVRNPARGHVHVVDFEPARFDRSFYAKHLWATL
ncbi:putative kinetochore protein spc24 [Taxawa tesnikishii (nom. ined.)]|nr:putative kinetochore protein spc24 [Dothideales sp. JES 119]